jgi:hypothetical protein
MQALGDIDRHFGEGYARVHPELIAAYMQAAVIDAGIGDLVEAVKDLAGAAHA